MKASITEAGIKALELKKGKTQRPGPSNGGVTSGRRTREEYDQERAARGQEQRTRARALRAAGKTWQEVGNAMDVSRQRAQELAGDDGSAEVRVVLSAGQISMLDARFTGQERAATVRQIVDEYFAKMGVVDGW